MGDNNSRQSEDSLEPTPALFPKAWTLDALLGARERCAGRSFAAEYQQVPLGEQEQVDRQRELDEEYHAHYRAWLRSKAARTAGPSLAVEGME